MISPHDGNASGLILDPGMTIGIAGLINFVEQVRQFTQVRLKASSMLRYVSGSCLESILRLITLRGVGC